MGDREEKEEEIPGTSMGWLLWGSVCLLQVHCLLDGELRARISMPREYDRINVLRFIQDRLKIWEKPLQKSCARRERENRYTITRPIK